MPVATATPLSSVASQLRCRVPALTRDLILGMDDLSRVRVDVPEWGGHLFVRSMTGMERDAFEGAMFNAKSETGQSTNSGQRTGPNALTTE